MSWYATWMPATPPPGGLEIRIIEQKQERDPCSVESIVDELSCADLIRNYPWLIRETKYETVMAVVSELKKESNIGLMVLRKKDGFQFITTLPFVRDAVATAPDPEFGAK